MTLLRSSLLACTVLAGVAPVIVLFWMMCSGRGWSASGRGCRTGGGSPWAGALLVFAVLSGLGIYLFALALARVLASRLEVEGPAPSVHLFTAGLVPVAGACGLVWLAIASMRIGF